MGGLASSFIKVSLNGDRKVAYEPSARLDSGITRSKVRGSSAIPEADCCGKSGGLDMMVIVLVRCTCDDSGMTGTE
jgi:hypothetical protein